MRTHRLSRAFKGFTHGLNLLKIEVNNTKEGSKVQLYTMLGESLRDTHEALSVFKKGQNELRVSM